MNKGIEGDTFSKRSNRKINFQKRKNFLKRVGDLKEFCEKECLGNI